MLAKGDSSREGIGPGKSASAIGVIPKGHLDGLHRCDQFVIGVSPVAGIVAIDEIRRHGIGGCGPRRGSGSCCCKNNEEGRCDEEEEKNPHGVLCCCFVGERSGVVVVFSNYLLLLGFYRAMSIILILLLLLLLLNGNHLNEKELIVSGLRDDDSVFSIRIQNSEFSNTNWGASA